MTEEQIKEQYDMFSAVWRFYKHYCNDLSEWEPVIMAADVIMRKYDTELCTAMTVAVMDELGRISQENKKTPQ